MNDDEQSNGAMPPTLLGSPMFCGLPATMTSKCGADPGSTSVIWTSNGANTLCTHDTTLFHVVVLYANGWMTLVVLIIQVSAIESLFPGRTVQPLAQRLRKMTCELTAGSTRDGSSDIRTIAVRGRSIATTGPVVSSIESPLPGVKVSESAAAGVATRSEAMTARRFIIYLCTCSSVRAPSTKVSLRPSVRDRSAYARRRRVMIAAISPSNSAIGPLLPEPELQPPPPLSAPGQHTPPLPATMQPKPPGQPPSRFGSHCSTQYLFMPSLAH